MSGGDRFDLICIGSGPAGESTARLAASWGHRVALIERQKVPGGAMVNTGTVTSKVLRETACLCASLRRRPLPGVEADIDRSVPFNRFLDRSALVQMEEHDRIELDLERADVDVVYGSARIDGHGQVHVTSNDGSERMMYTDRILIAVGSRPNRPNDIDFSHNAIVDSTEILSMEKMPRSLIVVGGDVVGSEYASIFAEMGVQTTLIEPRSTIIRFVDEECREILLEQMSEIGVRFKFGSRVRNVRVLENCYGEVELENGERLTADVVLWALGRTGNTEQLGLETVGIEPDERGLLRVDQNFSTSTFGIWAAGDVVGFPALASTSMEQARIAAANMFGEDTTTKVGGQLPMGIYTIPAVASIGPTETELRESGRNIVIGRTHYRHSACGRMLGDDRGIMKLVFDADSKTLLHATIVGEDATELIHIAMISIASEWSVTDLLNAPFTYPSLGDMYKTAARNALERIAINATRTNATGNSNAA